MKRVLVPLADGFEEMEGMIIVDVLRRAGFEVITASLHEGPVKAARQTTHIADMTLDEVLEKGLTFDLMVLPGGSQGAENLAADTRISTLLKEMKRQQKWIGAICAAPDVLLKNQILDDQDRFTLYPGTMSVPHSGYAPDERVVVSGKVVTSKGPGTAFEFALSLVEQLGGSALRDKVAAPLFLK
jgi:4-methyl-5(b-hydroxyethyl)-thiazole monophosphate biosynthesis